MSLVVKLELEVFGQEVATTINSIGNSKGIENIWRETR